VSGQLKFVCLVVLLFVSGRARADDCEAMAAQIAAKIGLDAGKRVPANFIPLRARTDDDDDYGAYLLCPRADFPMKLRYVSPPSQPPTWFDFVGRSGAILTSANPSLIILEAKRCVEKARSDGEIARSAAAGFMIECDVDKADGRAEIFLTRYTNPRRR